MGTKFSSLALGAWCGLLLGGLAHFYVRGIEHFFPKFTTDFAKTAQYFLEHPRDRIWLRLESELELTRAELMAIRASDHVLASQPVLRASIDRRNSFMAIKRRRRMAFSAASIASARRSIIGLCRCPFDRRFG